MRLASTESSVRIHCLSSFKFNSLSILACSSSIDTDVYLLRLVESVEWAIGVAGQVGYPLSWPSARRIFRTKAVAHKLVNRLLIELRNLCEKVAQLLRFAGAPDKRHVGVFTAPFDEILCRLKTRICLPLALVARKILFFFSGVVRCGVVRCGVVRCGVVSRMLACRWLTSSLLLGSSWLATCVPLAGVPTRTLYALCS